MATKPIKQLFRDGISISVWQNTSQKGNRFFSVKVVSKYEKESNGEKKYEESPFFSEYQLPTLITMLQSAAVGLYDFGGSGEKREGSSMNHLIKQELFRICGDAKDGYKFRENYCREVMKRIGIDKAYDAANDREKAILFAELVKIQPLSETKGGELDF